MPEQPPSKRRSLPRNPAVSEAGAERRAGGLAGGGPAPPYAELHCKSNFSFLEGASHPDELVERAAQMGYVALAITDRNSLAGVVRAHLAAKEAGLKLLVGAEITPLDAPPVVLLATDRAAYGRLARLITCGRRRAEKGECLLTFEDVAAHAEGLLAAVALDSAQRAAGSRQGSPHPDPPPQGGRERRGGGRQWGAEASAPGEASGEHCLQASSGTPQQGLQASSGTPLPLDQDRRAILPSRRLAVWRDGQEADALGRYREVFGDRCYALAELHLGADDGGKLERLVRQAKRAGVPLVAANDVYYHEPGRRALQDMLTATRAGCTVAEAGERLFPNAERYLKSPAEMAALFARVPEAVHRTREVAQRCTFSLDALHYEYPEPPLAAPSEGWEELVEAGLTPLRYLGELTWAGARERYPNGIPEKVRRLIEHELKLIEELRYEAYFLTVWDLVRFARSRGILCQGRGSAANSAVCYCLGVTSVDPERIDVLFERFVSRERNEAPDIDVDFEHERREEVLQYLYEKYGRERAGIVAEVITYRPRSAVRDVGKALGLSLDRVDALAKALDGYDDSAELPQRCREAGLDPDSPVGRQLASLVGQVVGFPRHLSQHVGGMVMTRGPLCELVPIENAAMPGRTVIQWDKDDLDALGILKVDCLALGMLTAIHKCFALIATSPFPPSQEGESAWGRRLTMAEVPAEDPAVYDMISRADTIGVFQIESRAQMAMLPRLRPRCFYDLVIEVAIVRPGPIQGQMVHPYLRRRAGLEAAEYPGEAVRGVLEKTLGVPLFQEQAMRLAVVAAGFTPGEADQLRRAMGGWRRPGLIEQFRQKLIGGMRARGYSAEFAQRVFRQIQGFGEYGFPESHAASFALLVYVSAWLKRYYPAAFAAALLNSQPMGFYAPAQLVRDAREHGVEVRPVDVNFSKWDCTPEAASGGQQAAGSGQQAVDADGRPPSSGGLAVDGYPQPALRLGLRMVRGLSRKDAECAEQARGERAFGSIAELARRTGLGQAVLVRLAKADAFGSLGLDRRTALWQALAAGGVESGGRRVEVRGQKTKNGRAKLPLSRDRGQRAESPAAPTEPASRQHDMPLFAADDRDEGTVELPRMAAAEVVVADYQSVGLSLRDHPMRFLRPALDERRVVRAAQLATLPAGQQVAVAGLVLVRQRPGTASGIIFVTLEDETGIANLIVRPQVWRAYHRAARTAAGLLAHGRLERQGDVIHVLVTKLEDLSGVLAELRSRSRDFH